jgi:hypothetical protein
VNLWDKAVQRLDDIDRQHFDIYQPDRRTALDDLLKVVEEKKRICEGKQWKYKKRNGDIVTIRDSLDKVVEWVRRFREIGDVVVQCDPTHAALPWAGLRLLLQVCQQFELSFTPAYCRHQYRSGCGK